MTTDAQSHFSNAFPGEHETFGGNLYRLDAAPKYAVGFRISRQDGNIYRYSHYGAATNRGVLVAMDDSAAVVNDSDNSLVDPTDATNTLDGTIGATRIEVKGQAQTRDQYAGAYLTTTDDTGEGYTYRVKGNTGATVATGGPSAGKYILELYDKLQVAIDSTTDIAIIGNMWSDLKVAATAADSSVSGVSTATATAALPYAFTQTWGVVACLQGAEVGAVGDLVKLSTITAGAIDQYAGTSTGTIAASDLAIGPVVGYIIDPGDSTGHTTMYLQVAP